MQWRGLKNGGIKRVSWSEAGGATNGRGAGTGTWVGSRNLARKQCFQPMGGLEGGMAGLAYQAGLALGPASTGGMPAIPHTASTTPTTALGIQCKFGFFKHSKF